MLTKQATAADIQALRKKGWTWKAIGGRFGITESAARNRARARPKTARRLTQEYLRSVFEYHQDGFLTWKTPPRGRLLGQPAGHLLNTGYVQVMLDYKQYLMHRLVWLWHHGTVPPMLDHIDRNRANNRIENLRPATGSQNTGNASFISDRKKTTSRWRGVHLEKSTGKWRATLQVAGRSSHLGCFACEADAAQAYNFAAAAYFGEFAHLNCAEQTCALVTKND